MKVIVRSDSSRSIGAGHITRCMALAHALRARGASVTFVCRLDEGHLGDLIQAQGFELISLSGSTATTEWHDDAMATKGAIDQLGSRPDWLIVDHYALDMKWEQSVRASVAAIAVIDDLAREHECDLLIDQNMYVDAEFRYAGKVPASCRLLLGPRYALLRDEFRKMRVLQQARADGVRRLLVFFGGADTAGWTTTAIHALAGQQFQGIEVDVVIGAQNANRAAIEVSCRSNGFSCHVQSERMEELMCAADFAIGAGGSAHWERCCLGLPCLTVALAANQRQLTHDGALLGLLIAPAVSAGDSDALARHVRACIENPLLRSGISRRGAEAVDGRGTQRVLRYMGVSAVSVRAAVTTDCERVFEWRNAADVRRVSRNTSELTWAAHCEWFEAVLSDPARDLLIGEAESRPVGVVRFDVSDDEAEMSIYMAPGESGCGFGTELVLAAELWVSQSRPHLRCVRAEVLEENLKSHGLFRSAGYRVGSTTYAKVLN
jgi:UDP-2,4-diacetamido-2,4,6-trideoxy-beta-L-altropyranose hydrolase